MDNRSTGISAYQLGIFLIVTMVGVGILTLPREVVEIADTDGWMLVLSSGALTMGLSLIINYLSSLFPNQTVIEYSGELMGRPLGLVVGILFMANYIIFAAFSVRIFGEVLKIFLLPRTPIEVIIMTFLIASAYLVRKGLEGIARFYEIISLIKFIPFFLALLAGASQVDFTNLLPIFQASPLRMASGTLQIIFSFLGFEILFLFLPYVSDRGNIKKSLIISVSIIIMIYLFTVFFVIASFGSEEVKLLMWPLMAYIKSVQVPGAFIEQLEGVIMTIWVLFIYTTMSTMCFSASFTINRLLKTQEQRIYAVAILPLIYFLSLLPDNPPQLYDWLSIVAVYLGNAIALFLPILLLLLAKIRKKGVKTDG